MGQVVILLCTLYIAFVSAVNLQSKSESVAENSMSILGEGASTYKQWNFGQDYGRPKRSPDTRTTGTIISAKQTTINNLKQTIDEKEKMLTFLKQSSSARDLEYKSQIGVLQEEVRNLKTQLENIDENNTQKLNELSQQVQRLTSQVNDLTTRILPYDTILDIENSRFVAAEEKMNKINDEKEVGKIIRQVSRPENFDLLNEFQKSLQSATFKLLVFENLALMSDDVSVRKVSDLLQSVNGILSRYTDANTRLRATTVLNGLQHSKKMTIYNQLKEALISLNHSPNTDVVFLEDRELFNESLRQVIFDFYNSLGLDKILNFADGYSYYGQSMEAYAVIYDLLKVKGRQRSQDVLDLAEFIYKKQKNKRRADAKSEETANKLKRDLPASVSALAFSADEVVIKNSRSNVCLRADITSTLLAYPRTSSHGSWRFEKRGQQYKIKKNGNSESAAYLQRDGVLASAFSGSSRLYSVIESQVESHETDWTINVLPDGVNIVHKRHGMALCWNFLHFVAVRHDMDSEHCVWKIEPTRSASNSEKVDLSITPSDMLYFNAFLPKLW